MSDDIASNGNINLIDGSATILSANNGGDAGLDYDGSLYISDDFALNNRSGVAGPDGMGMGGAPSQMGQMGGQMNGAPTDNMSGPSGQMGQQNGAPGNMVGGMNNQMGGARMGR